MTIFLLLSKNVLATYTISINDLPQSININDPQDISLELIVKLGKGSEYYLRAAFSHSDSPSDYFGYTNGYNDKDAKNFYKINTDENGQWEGILRIRPDINSPYFKGEGIYNFKIGYYTAAGSGPSWRYENTIFLSYLVSLTPTQSVSTPTLIPTLSSTPALKPTATYKINEVKDEDGEVLSNVKVYVDGIYLHHYTPEVLTFCDDCQCDNCVSCGFGQHTIKLEKTGYEDWSKEITINPDSFDEVNPAMVFLESNPTSTLVPTLEIPTPTLPLKAVNVLATFSGEILGEDNMEEENFYPLESSQSASKEEITHHSSFTFLPKLILSLGAIFLLSGGLWLWYNLKD